MNKIDVIIFAGQSNMQGQSEMLTDVDVVERAYEYKFLSNTMVPLQNPVGEDVRYNMSAGYPFAEETNLEEWLQEHALGSTCYGNTNLIPAFAKAYLDTCKMEAEILAVHVAKGSTRIAKWLPGTPGHDVLIHKCKAALEFANNNGQIAHVYFVWLQGESDAIAHISKYEYKEKLKILHASLQEELGVECFGIIRVGRFTNDERDMEIIEAQNDVCHQETGFLMLTEIATELNKHAEYMNPHVDGHYSAKGLETLGTLAGQTLATYRNGQ